MARKDTKAPEFGELLSALGVRPPEEDLGAGAAPKVPSSIDSVARYLVEECSMPLHPDEFAMVAGTRHRTVATKIRRPDRLVHDVLAVATIWRRPMQFVKLSAMANCGQWIQFAELGVSSLGQVQCGSCTQLQERARAKWRSGLVDF